MRRFCTYLLIILLGTSAMACSKGPTASRNTKKVKRGKPMPCPVKDC